MPVYRFDLLGSPNIGVYALTTNKLILLPVQIPSSKRKRLTETLKGKVVHTTLGGTKLIGVLAAANSNGIVLPHYVYNEEIAAIKEAWDGNITRINGKRTAYGNLILVNDQGAIASKQLMKEKNCIKAIQDVLDVEIVPGEIAGLQYVGSLATATNKGALAHPLLKDKERQLIIDILKVPVDAGTINGGVPFISSGLLANEYGVLIGNPTTGPEIIMITNMLNG